MRYMLGLLCLAVAAGLPSTASADFIVDDFSNFEVGPSGPTSVSPNGVLRTLAGGSISTGAGIFSASTASSPAVTYDFTSLFGGSLDPESNFLLFRDIAYSPTNPSVGSIVLTFTSAVGPSSTTSAQIIPPGTNDVYVDITGISGVGQLTSLAVDFLGDGTVTMGAPLEFVAVPEPASVALMGMAIVSAGGVGAVRRRRSKSEPTEEPVVAA